MDLTVNCRPFPYKLPLFNNLSLHRRTERYMHISVKPHTLSASISFIGTHSTRPEEGDSERGSVRLPWASLHHQDFTSDGLCKQAMSVGDRNPMQFHTHTHTHSCLKVRSSPEKMRVADVAVVLKLRKLKVLREKFRGWHGVNKKLKE